MKKREGDARGSVPYVPRLSTRRGRRDSETAVLLYYYFIPGILDNWVFRPFHFLFHVYVPSSTPCARSASSVSSRSVNRFVVPL